MSEFVEVARVSAFPNPGRQTIEIDDRMVVLFRVGDEFYCLDDVCTHDGGPLGDGAFDPCANTIACPRHGAKFDVRSGRALTMPATENTVRYEVKIVEDKIFIKPSDE